MQEPEEGEGITPLLPETQSRGTLHQVPCLGHSSGICSTEERVWYLQHRGTRVGVELGGH
jgi:hypothetical protein